MVGIVQLVRTSDCGSEGRGFDSHYSPFIKKVRFICYIDMNLLKMIIE